MTSYQNTYTASRLLAIGIDCYADPCFVPLGDAENDAQSLAEVLGAAPYGFEVSLLLGAEATKPAVISALAELRKSGPDDRILFYFAGHGYTLTDNLGNQVGYLACADTVPDNPYAGLQFDEVTAIRRWAKAKHIAFVLDACFSGRALGLTRAAVPQASVEEYLQRRAWQVLTAGGDEVVSDAHSMTGMLVQTLCEGIPGEAGPLTFSHVGQYIKDTVAGRSQRMQIPVCQYLDGSSNGEMILCVPSAAHPIDLLPEDLRADLTDANPRLRLRAIADAERLLSDPVLGEAVCAVLGAMQVDDEDRGVRRRAAEAMQVAPVKAPSTPPRSEVSEPAPLRPHHAPVMPVTPSPSAAMTVEPEIAHPAPVSEKLMVRTVNRLGVETAISVSEISVKGDPILEHLLRFHGGRGFGDQSHPYAIPLTVAPSVIMLIPWAVFKGAVRGPQGHEVKLINEQVVIGRFSADLIGPEQMRLPLADIEQMEIMSGPESVLSTRGKGEGLPTIWQLDVLDPKGPTYGVCDPQFAFTTQTSHPMGAFTHGDTTKEFYLVMGGELDEKALAYFDHFQSVAFEKPSHLTVTTLQGQETSGMLAVYGKGSSYYMSRNIVEKVGSNPSLLVCWAELPAIKILIYAKKWQMQRAR